MDDPRSVLADGFITKTVDLNGLKAKIKELLENLHDIPRLSSK